MKQAWRFWSKQLMKKIRTRIVPDSSNSSFCPTTRQFCLRSKWWRSRHPTSQWLQVKPKEKEPASWRKGNANRLSNCKPSPGRHITAVTRSIKSWSEIWRTRATIWLPCLSDPGKKGPPHPAPDCKNWPGLPSLSRSGSSSWTGTWACSSAKSAKWTRVSMTFVIICTSTSRIKTDLQCLCREITIPMAWLSKWMLTLHYRSKWVGYLRCHKLSQTMQKRRCLKDWQMSRSMIVASCNVAVAMARIASLIKGSTQVWTRQTR